MSRVSDLTAVIDYGMGNLHSVQKALQHVSPTTNVVVTSDTNVIEAADHLIFPGVGAIRDCMAEIKNLHLHELLPEWIKEKPVLAICVGLQALMETSEENDGVDCIGVIPGQVKYFGTPLFATEGDTPTALGGRLKVPHMGWNQVKQVQSHPLWNNIPDNSRFYFVHSFYAHCSSSQWRYGTGHYGKAFDAVLAQGNVFATQFHPEKSQHMGLQLLKNFLHWWGESTC